MSVYLLIDNLKTHQNSFLDMRHKSRKQTTENSLSVSEPFDQPFLNHLTSRFSTINPKTTQLIFSRKHLMRVLKLHNN